MFKPKVTLQYPEEKPSIPQNYRGVPTLVKDPNGREKCVSCQLCEFVCPPKAIRITPGSVPEEESEREHVEKAPEEFEINMLRCIYCGYCQEVCPEEAIFLQDEYSSPPVILEKRWSIIKPNFMSWEALCLTLIINGIRKRKKKLRETPTNLFF